MLKANVSSFRLEQFDARVPIEESVFAVYCTGLYVTINIASLFPTTVLWYVGFRAAFVASAGTMVVGMIVFLVGASNYLGAELAYMCWVQMTPTTFADQVALYK